MHTATTSHDTHIAQNAHKRPDKAGIHILNRYFGKQFCAWLKSTLQPSADVQQRSAAAQYSRIACATEPCAGMARRSKS